MKPLLYILAVLAAAGAAIAIWMNVDTPETDTTVPSVQVNTSSQNTNSLAGPVQIYAVAIDDGGKTGRLIGCNDSLLNVPQTVDDATDIKTALNALFAFRSDSQATYTALTNSQLVIDEAVVTNGAATIRLSGAYQLGGTCDGPRFVEQITQTVIDFPGVETAVITINDQPLASVASQRGE